MPRCQSCGLDLLNRRIGTPDVASLGIWDDLDKNGAVDTNEFTHSHDHVVGKYDALNGLDDDSTDTSVGHDPAGSITFMDGRFIH